ncbi:glycosyltransferase [Psychrosphaera sp. 1_MG-2023]|uniref:glycosyltransferase family 8 protein n=1 Tax=Psychrosphaera sp. 1_MG-2023 TaxID=3062643 RepID=UPI0026E3A598|nr:glycosyltransferase [Psychrosphaera sp. 1_MG-2023]MDO6719345.1 glycosyltransferase [Psychrosphaera sp. 1_MG-2023]
MKDKMITNQDSEMGCTPQDSDIKLSLKKSENLETLTVVSCANEKFSCGLVMSMVSALAHSSGEFFYELIVLDGGLSEATRMSLNLKLQDVSNRIGTPFSLKFISPSKESIDKLPKRVGSWMTYARFLLAEILPQKAVIYLDSDILCFRGIEEFYTSWDNVAPIVASRDPKQTIDKDWPDEANEAPKGVMYFNAGLILLNLDWMRCNLPLAKVEELVAKFGMDRLKFHDQTILNYMSHGKVIEVARENNWVLATEYAMQVIDNWQSVNIHYVGRVKPWLRQKTEARRFIPEVLYFQASKVYCIDGVKERVLDEQDLKVVRNKARFYKWLKPTRARTYQSVLKSLSRQVELESKLTSDVFYRR